MNATYDVIGYGEGISGLIASVLLSNKGFSCLWADTSVMEEGRPLQSHIPALISRGFWEHGVKPILGAVDTSIIEHIRPRRIQLMQSILPAMRIDINPEDRYTGLALPKKMQKKYLSFLSNLMTRPMTRMHTPRGILPQLEPWEKNFISGLSNVRNMKYISYLRYMSSLIGMYSIDYGEAKDVLGMYLSNAKGDYIRATTDVDYQYQGKQITGARINGAKLKSRFYLAEDLLKPDNPDGFVFYGKCELAKDVIPVGMGDLLVISPSEDMDYPIVLNVDHRSSTSMISLVTRVRVGNTLTSLVENLSWASGMIMKRLRQIIPFLDDFLLSFDVVEPFENNTIRPWFAYKDREKIPWFFQTKRYINPIEKVYKCNRMRCGCLDFEGEVLWGICVANAILTELNRSDLIKKKMV
jgi:hypothetical protein